jgi:processive 1,2-diacylglycerol beta-glucosyltransferase
MSSPPRPRILLATAGFGDGHNSAARNLAQALSPRAEVLIADPCAKGAPLLNESLRSGYRLVTTYAPSLWAKVYRGVEKRDFSKRQFSFMRRAEASLDTAIDTFAPDVLVSTYPLYPYFMDRHRKRLQRPLPIITVVTDSIEINAAWRNAPTDYWLVTDQETRKRLIDRDLPEERIVETGFPVDPSFAELPTIAADDPLNEFRILFFPTSKRPAVRRITRTLLDHPGGQTKVTIVLGRNFRKLYHRAREMKESYPGRVRILAWTKRVPELLTSHHLVVGKAGGATVHEALAASTPMLIHHLVPGQEEGNLELLRRRGGGRLADSEQSLAAALRDLLTDQATLWRSQKRHLAQQARPNASIVAANFILGQLPKTGPT